MNIHDYNRVVKASWAGESAKSEVLFPAAGIAQEMDLEFVAPAHVLLAMLRSDHALRRRVALEGVGVTYAAVEDCLLNAPWWTFSPERSEGALRRMFAIAEGPLVARRDEGATPTFGIGDLMLACLASGDPVLGLVIETRLETTAFEMLVELDAPDMVVLECAPPMEFTFQLEEILAAAA